VLELARCASVLAHPASDGSDLSHHIEVKQPDLSEGTRPHLPLSAATPLAPFAIRDGQIITGQQQHSTRLFSDLLIEALSE